MNKNGPGSMNRVYRLVWNERTGTYVAVAESARGRGKRSSGVSGFVLAAGLLLGGPVALAAGPPAANALPQNGSVVSGQASLQQGVNRLDITQGTNKAAINWQSFDIGSAAQVNIVQPGAQSVLLNRVLGADPSGIYGKLSANGQVLLVNPNGIVFGKGSQVDVGGLVASSLDIADADFSAGRMAFKRGGKAGAVTNLGTLNTAAGGYVALLAPEVLNEGVVSARLGTVALAAGDAVTLALDGNQLLGVKVDPSTIDALVENRQLVQAEGGRVILSAGAAQRLREQAVAGDSGANALVAGDNGAMRLVAAGGRIEAGSGQVSLSGSTVDASGTVRGASIAVQADHLSQGGTLDASGAAAGGRIAIDAGAIVQTASAQLKADGGTAGGDIRVAGGHTVYSSARFSAQGAAGLGGEIALSADSVQLRAATLDASGTDGGGRVRVGGGFQGRDSDIANARNVGINGTTVLRADATVRGDGGQVVVWADDKTVYGGSLSARAGASGGNGGRAEVSGKGDLTFAGTADLAAPKGAAGQLLLDPRNILIDNAGNSLASLDLADPTPSDSNGFGTFTQVLGNGNVIITAPGADTGGQLGTGAVYLFNSQTGALLSNLRGSHAGDHAGSGGVQVLGNGNYLVLSPLYATVSGVNTFSTSKDDPNTVPGASAYAILQNGTASAGAISWQSGSGSNSSAIGSGNSLLGSTANTESVTRYSYSGSTINNNGSVTITANDRLGSVTTYDIYGSVAVQGTTNIVELADGNVAIAATNWFNGRGAVAWMNGSTGALADASAGGAVSSANAFVGSTGIRSLAPSVTDSNSRKVYVTGVDSSLPFTFTQGSTNRRLAPPGAAGDSIGSTVTPLPDGGYVIASPLFTNGAGLYAGAATHGAAGGSSGTVSSTNSLVGSNSYDFVSSGGVSVVGGGSGYVVASPYWTDSGNAAVGRYLQNDPNGAVTWVDSSTGHIFGAGSNGAAVSSSNSLTGGAGDLFGSRGNSSSTPTTTYDYNTSFQLTTTSSTRANASSSGVTVLKNGHYLVTDIDWNGSRGAVAFGTGAAGVGGAVGAANALIGASAGDGVGQGGVLELSGSNYLVLSPYADIGSADGGAATWAAGSSGLVGAISTGNSLYGTAAGSRVGLGGAFGVGSVDGQGLRAHAIVLSPEWGNRSSSISTVAYGAVTWIDGSTGYATGQSASGGAVSSANSLVGDHDGDYVGSVHSADQRAVLSAGNGSNLQQVQGSWNAVLGATVDILANGDYLVRSPNWDSGKGAITWGAGGAGVAGTISAANSLVGSVSDVVSTSSSNSTRAGMSFTDTTYRLTTTGDHVGLLSETLAGGNAIAISPWWNGGRGAVTWIGAGNRTGTIGSGNSLVGSTPDTYSDANHGAITATGDRLGTMPNTNWVVPVISEAVVGGNTLTTSSVRPVGPYAMASGSNVVTESWYSGGGSVTLGKAYSVTATVNLQTTEEWGYLSTNFRYNGVSIVKELANGNVLVASPGWNNGAAAFAGAISWIDGSTGALTGGGSGGSVSAANSLVGSHANDLLGFRLPVDGVTELSNGNFVLLNPQWYAERGAVTWGSGTAGVAGTVSAANSLVGDTGSTGLVFATINNSYRITHGAILNGDWLDRVSNNGGDRVGAAGVTALADGNAVIGSPLWQQSSAWTQTDAPTSLGAVTWLNGSTGALRTGAAGGSISSANSLVGTQAGDAVGYSPWVDPGSGQHYIASGVTALAGGRYAVASPWWSNGATANVGAVTFAPNGGIAGTVSASNSLVGATAGDHVGRSLSSVDWYSYGAQIDAGVVALDLGNGSINYMVRSVDWTSGYGNGTGTAAAGAGAVTWVDGSNGHAYGQSGTSAVVSEANSLTGSSAGDAVGQQSIVLRRSNGSATGDLLLLSNLGYCGVDGAGAITLFSGSHGAAGPVSWRNSLIGVAPADAGLATTGFDGWIYSTDVRATVLPVAPTAAEQVAARPLVWVAPNASSGKNASHAYALTLLADDNAAANAANQLNGQNGNANWSGSHFAGDGAGMAGVGTSSGTLAFATHSGSDVVITPAALTALLNAGTAVTLQASNDITVLRDVITSAGGNGGNLTFEAGRSIHIRANIDTDNGTFTALANQSASHGVVDSDCSLCTAVISQAAGTWINTGSSHLWLNLLNSTDKTNNDAGTVRISSLSGDFVQVSNAGFDGSGHARGIRFNPGATIGDSSVTSRVEIYVGGNTAAGGGLLLASDTQFRGMDTLNVGPSDYGNGMVLGAASAGANLAITAAEIGAVIQHSSGFGALQFGSGGTGGLTTVNALDFTQAAMLRGGSTLNSHIEITGGSGGITVNGALKSAITNGYGFQLVSWGGPLTLASGSAITAATGQFTLFGDNNTITQQSGGTINAARLGLGGSSSIDLRAGTNTIGTIAGNVASSGQIKTSGSVTIGSGGLAFDGNLTLQASGASADLTLNGVASSANGDVVLAAGRDFINHNSLDTGIAAANGRYLVYSTNPTASTEGMSGYAKHYAQSYSAGSTPGYAASGSWFLYSVAPTITVSAGSGSTVTYGSGASAPSLAVAGFIDGDTLGSATTGSLDSSLSSYTPSSAGYIPAGTYTLTLNGQGTLASSLGYAISVTPGSSALTVQPKAINVSGLTADSKVYDGTTATTVSGSGSLQNGGSGTSDGRVFSADAVSLGGTATGAFADRHAGTGKSVTLSGLSLNGADAGNYTISAGSVTADITPKALTVSGLSVANSRVYNGNTAATVLGSGALLSSETAGSGSTADGTPYSLDTISLGGTATATYNAASVAGASTVTFGGLTLSGAHAGNYSLSFGTQAATITPKALSVTGVTAQNKVYDATTTASFTGTAGLSGVVGSDAVSLAGTLAGSFAGANVGTGIGITTSGLGLTGGAAGNYTLTAYSPSANITARTLTVTADNQAKTYGDADPTLTFSVGGLGLAGGDTLAGVFGGALSTSTGAAATAGTHAIGQGTLALSNGNYTLGSYTAGTLTVAKAQLQVTVDNKAKTYGDADPALSYTVNASQLKYTDSASVVSGMNLATATGAAATAGTHAITASGGSAANYDLVLADGTLSVAKAQLQVSADNKAKTYGDADPGLSYTVNSTQLKYTDGASVVSGLNLVTATGAAATAGTHAITASGGSAANYDLVLADGTLSVAKAQLQVSADNKAKTYGDADPSLSYTVNAAQLKYTDGASVVSGVNLATATGAAATAGTHAITASGGSAANYDLVLADGTLSVAKAQLQVIADNKTKTYGDADPGLSYTVNAAQLKYADGASVVSGVNLATATGAAATAGTHAITASGGSAANYDLVLADGTLSVAKAQLQVTADNKTKTYGDADPALSYTVNTSQLKYADTAAVAGNLVLSTASGAAATAGNHVIAIEGGSAANYELVRTNGTLSVAKAQLQVSADNRAKTYGDADPALSYSVHTAQLKYADTASVVNGLNLTTATGAAATAGTHAITASGGSADNYVLVLANGTLSVAKAQLQVTADNKAKTYGDADPTLSYTVNAAQLKYADGASVVGGVTLASASGAAATAGTHAITATGGSATNYDVVLSNGTLSVAKAALAVTADNQSKTYGDADPALGYSINTSQLKYGDSAGVVSGLALSAPTGAAATAGTHAIALSGGSAANYMLVLNNGTLSVAKAELAVTADNQSKTYGDADPTLSYTVNASQLKYADGAGVVGGLNLATAGGAAATAGTHAITLSGGSAANYVLVLNNGTLSVAKADLAVTADHKSKTYGDADPALSYTVNAAQLKYADGAGVVSGLVLNTQVGAAATAGTHAITLAGGSAANYRLVLADGVLTVAKAPLTVIADPASKTAGETDPGLSWHVDAAQLRHGDGAGVVSGVTLTAPAGAGLPPGTYAIVGANGQAANYELSYVDGVLVVKPSPSVKAENLSTQVPPLAAQQPAALPPGPGSTQAVAGPALPGTLTVVGGGLTLPVQTAASGGSPSLSSSEPAAAATGVTAPPPAATAASATTAASAGTVTVAVEASGSARLVAVRPLNEVERRPDGGIRFDAAAAFERPPEAKASYSATLADGRPLPGWLSLDNTSGVLSGAVPPGTPATVEVLVTARLENGAVATTRVRVKTRR